MGDRFAPLADVDGGGTRGRVVDALPPIARAVAQIVQVPHRDVCQPLVLRLPEYCVGPLQDPPRGPSVQPPMGLIDFHQQRHIRRRVDACKLAPPIRGDPNRLRLSELPDHARHLCPAPPRHFHHVPVNQPLVGPTQLRVVMTPQHAFHPGVNVRAPLGMEMHFLVRFHKGPHLLQAWVLVLLHSNEHSPT